MVGNSEIVASCLVSRLTISVVVWKRIAAAEGAMGEVVRTTQKEVSLFRVQFCKLSMSRHPHRTLSRDFLRADFAPACLSAVQSSDCSLSTRSP